MIAQNLPVFKCFLTDFDKKRYTERGRKKPEAFYVLRYLYCLFNLCISVLLKGNEFVSIESKHPFVANLHFIAQSFTH